MTSLLNKSPAYCCLVYDSTQIYSRLRQSVAMALPYPACGTAIPYLLNSPYFTSPGSPSSGHTKISKPSGAFPSIITGLEEVKSIGNPAGIGKGTGFWLRERDRDGIGLGHYRLRASKNYSEIPDRKNTLSTLGVLGVQ